MTREALLETALKTMVTASRFALQSQQKHEQWSRQGTNSPTAKRAEDRYDYAMQRLDVADKMASFALKGNVTLFNEAEADYHAMVEKKVRL